METPVDLIKGLVEHAKIEVETTVHLGIARTALSRIVAINPAWAERCKAALNVIGEV